MVAGLLSCAYYNILWTANKEYEKATRALDFAEFWDPYEQKKLAGEQVRLVDSAANRCGKVLVLHADSKWVDDALLLMGKCFLLGRDYEKALKKFREVNMLYSDGDLSEEARYMEAYTLVLHGSADEAQTKLQNLAASADDDRIREKAAYLLPRVSLADGDCLLAIDGFAAYLEDYANGGRAGQARLALGECLVKLGMYREAIEDLQPLIGKLDDNGVRALLRVGKAHRMLGERDTAIGIFGRIMEGAAEDTLRARAGIEEAMTILVEGRYEDAVQALALADSIGARKLTGEINYRIGLVYERDLGDFENATAHYDESVKRKSEYSKIAAKRSRALKNIKKYRDEIAAGTGDVAKTRYLLAETYLYDLGMQERAVEELVAVTDSFPDSQYAARSMLALAAHLRSEGDDAAIAYYERIVENFPGTAYANVARIALGLAPIDVVEEKPDAAAPEAAAPRDTLGVSRRDLASPEEGRPDAPPQGGERPGGVPGSMEPTPGDSLAGEDSVLPGETSLEAMDPDIMRTFPGISDSARSRYEGYLDFTGTGPAEEDTAARDTTGVRPEEE